MGYHLTILRPQAASQPQIAPTEFVTACQGLPALHLDVGGQLAILKLQEGKVWTNVASSEVLTVMIELAQKLNARVRGDEGESYCTLDETYTHPDDAAEVTADELEARRWQFRRRLWNFIRLIVLFITLCLIIADWMQGK